MGNLRVGVFGCRRGNSLAKDFMLAGCEIVAACDFAEEPREKARNTFGKDCKIYDCFDDFIEHDMDAVILANFFNEHAPYAIKCFEKNLHVYSECISNGTMAEGIELIRAAKNTSSIYMLAENYPQMIFNREMQKICATGSLGDILYAEGEYNHPVSAYDKEFTKGYVYYPKHWRNFAPATYYITHSLGPLMRATGATPKKVSAFGIFSPKEKDEPNASHVGESTAIINILNDDRSVFRVTGCGKFGGHHNAYRICGKKGQIENLRGMGDKVMLRYNAWEIPEGKEEINLYDAKWNDSDEDLIKTSGHGGADFLTVRMFIDAIKKNEQPPHPFCLHSAVAMSSVAILAHRSIIEGGKPFEIPDFHDEEWCKKYENDRLSPFWGPDGTPPTLPSCATDPNYKPSEEQMQKYLDLLK